MSGRKRLISVILIMTVISFTLVGVTVFLLYNTAIEEERERLAETAQSQARLIEAIARFNALYPVDYPRGSLAATLAQIEDAHTRYKGFGKTGEFALGRLVKDEIVFVLSHGHFDLFHPNPVPFESENGEPMRRALLGQSGTMIGLDYRGKTVLAAYEPVKEMNLGIVAKIDLSEVRAPFKRVIFLTLLISVLLILGGASLFVGISNPIIKKLKEHSLELEKRVAERTAELSQSNALLMQEMGQRNHAEDQLRNNQQMLQSIFDGISDPLLLLSKDLNIKLLNKSAAEYYGLSEPLEVLGKRCHIGLSGEPNPCKGCTIPSAVLSDKKKIYERKGIKDSRCFEIVVVDPLEKENGESGDIIVRITDITERKLFERQLIQSEKMASLGIMVSSIAHEINNPNTFISFNLPILKEYLSALLDITDEKAAAHPDFDLFNMSYPEFRKDILTLFDNLRHGSERIFTFVSNLREFARIKISYTEDWTDLRSVFEKALAICQNRINKAVRSVNIDMPPDFPRICSDPEALEHILINLLMNAAQAADKKDSWIKITVKAGDSWLDHTIIELKDNGCGIDKKNLKYIFDPFFTTKTCSEGTGLGLYICHNLITGLRGRIDVDSEAGKYSTFRVALPDKERRSISRD